MMATRFGCFILVLVIALMCFLGHILDAGYLAMIAPVNIERLTQQMYNTIDQSHNGTEENSGIGYITKNNTVAALSMDDTILENWHRKMSTKLSSKRLADGTRLPCSKNTNNFTSVYTLTVSSAGRLGNNMWEYSTLLGISNLTGRQAVLPASFEYMKTIFKLSIPIDYNLSKSDSEKVKVRADFAYDTPHNVETLASTVNNTPCNLILQGFFQSLNYSNHVNLRQDFSFTTNISKHVHRYFQQLELPEDVIKVGIHMRITELNSTVFREIGRGAPPETYYHHAMEYFRKRFRGRTVVFILSSDDLDLARKQLGMSDITVVPNMDPGLDMAILASCEHVIVSNGTYSWWIGWLCHGLTVRYRKMPPKGSPLDIRAGGKYWPDDDQFNHYVAIE